MKIQVVYASSSKYPNSSDLSGWCPPLGILTIATSLKHKFPKHKIEIYDSQIEERENIAEKLNGDIVGISSGVLSYEDALYFADKAKANNSTIVLGGPYVSVIPEIVLKKRRFIDFVCVGDGIPALEALIKAKDVPKSNPIDLKHLPIPDRELLPLHKYFENFRRRFPDSEFTSPTGMTPQIGCSYKSRGKGCIFCSGTDSGSSKTPGQFWEEVLYLQSLDIDYISVQAEELLGNLDWFKEVYQNKPGNNVPLEVITRASRITEPIIKKLKDMNVCRIFIGAESGSQKLLNTAMKGMKTEHVTRAVDLMKRYGIKTKATFILGLPGEDDNTLKETIDFAEDLCKRGDVETIGVSILTPIPGSPAYSIFLEKFHEFAEKDIFPIEESRRLWVREFCDVDYGSLVKAVETISSLASFCSYGFARKI
jgi:radical SAM superfamily enzyme YgiQ (UPF0313 family)